MSQALRVLIVDDDPSTCLILEHTLRAKDIIAEHTTEPKKAAQLLREQAFDYVISDLLMPDISGIEFLIWANYHVPQTKVLLMTGFPTDELQAMALQMGASLFLPKPIDLDALTQHLLTQPPPLFTGNIQQIRLFDLLQVLSLTAKQYVLQLSDPDHFISGKIWLDAGKIVHAEAQERAQHASGEDALFLLCQNEGGAFSQEAWTAPPQETITEPLEALLFNIAQRLDEGPQKPRPMKTQVFSRGGQRILIVDDEPGVLIVLEQFLEREGFVVRTALGGTEAQRLLQEEPFEILLSDIHMPDLDGLSLLLWARTHCPTLHVILMTSTPLEVYDELRKTIRGLGFLSKPVDTDRLLAYLMPVMTPIQSGYKGEVNRVQILDLMQMYLLGRQQIVLELLDALTQETGKLYLSSGQLIHAQMGALQGEEAFYRMAAVRSGMFHERPWQVPSSESLREVPINRLMLKAGQAQLESTADSADQLEIDPALLRNIEAKMGLI